MYQTITLSNGLRIVYEKLPFLRSISFGIWVQNGSRNESNENNGISHFIEHMLFKGTNNRTAKEIADEMDAIGGQMNAFTAKEYTCYYTRTLDNHFDIALDILSDMFFNSNFDDTEIEKERNVILEEINMYEDTPEDLVHDAMQSKVWINDSLGYPILGTKKSISTFTNNTFVDYFTKNYRPENTVIAVCGNFDENELMKKIEKYFLPFTRDNQYAFKNYNNVYTKSLVTRKKDIEQLHLVLSFPGIEIGSDQSYVLAVMNTLFGGGMSSRLFQKLREDKGLVYTIYSYGSSYKNVGLYSIYAALSPNQVNEAIKHIIDEANHMIHESINKKTLYNVKEQLKSNYMLGLESSSNIMSSIGKTQLMMNKTLTPDQIIANIDEVTIEKVCDLSKYLLNLNNMSLSAVGKTDDLDFERMIGFE